MTGFISRYVRGGRGGRKRRMEEERRRVILAALPDEGVGKGESVKKTGENNDQISTQSE